MNKKFWSSGVILVAATLLLLLTGCVYQTQSMCIPEIRKDIPNFY